MPTSFNDIPGLKIGHAQNFEAATGCTVVLTTDGAICGIDQRGGAPGTRETDLLRPMHMIEHVHALLLTGGSAFGLVAADGVMGWLEEQGIGFDTGVARIPIVPAAVLFDLTIGRSDIRPDATMGYEACRVAFHQNKKPLKTGTIGAGTGATVGKILGTAAQMKGGLGTAVIELGHGLLVGAVLVVNCLGDVVHPESGRILAGTRNLSDGGFANSLQILKEIGGNFTTPGNTVIGIVATNAILSKDAANKVAQMAHDGLARTIRPAHTMFDGDTIFALATGKSKEADVNLIGAFAAEAVSQAVIDAVQNATPLAGVPAMNERNYDHN